MIRLKEFFFFFLLSTPTTVSTKWVLIYGDFHVSQSHAVGDVDFGVLHLLLLPSEHAKTVGGGVSTTVVGSRGEHGNLQCRTGELDLFTSYY